MIAWKAIQTATDNNALVPILGPDLADYILGGSHDIAQPLAAEQAIPVLPGQRPDPAAIAQAIQTKVARETLNKSVRDESLRRLEAGADRLSGTPTAEGSSEAKLLDTIVDSLSNDNAPFTILAGLNAKVFISCASDLLLKRFLRKAGKNPYEFTPDWRNEGNNGFDRLSAAAGALLDDFEALPNAAPADLIEAWIAKQSSANNPALIPIRALRHALLERLADAPGQSALTTVRQWREAFRQPPVDLDIRPWPIATPVLYYAFGKQVYSDSLVLTEDDFFDYLMQYARYDFMPPMVSDSLVAGSLLFVGFALDDWKFRILFRTIRRKGGSALHSARKYKHVGVQLDPNDYTPAEAARLKRLLRDYFKAANIDIYWGSSADFLRDLKSRMKKPAPRIAEAF